MSSLHLGPPIFQRQSIILWLISCVFVLAAVLLLARLGHYALWDDEAATALHAEGVWQTGDTSAVLSYNIVATYNGVNLRNLHERLEPPLQSYLAAPFVGLMGNNALAARLPFALCGLATVALMLWWLWRDAAGIWTVVIFAMGLLGNVSFFLYCRQSRYYAAAILASLALAYIYFHWNGSRRTLTGFAMVSVCLFAANYLSYLAFNVCLLIDYFIWGRKRRILSIVDWLCIVLPQIPFLALVALIWNPLGMDVHHSRPLQNIGDRFVLLWWNLRDMNRAEITSLLLLIAAPFVSLVKKGNLYLLRASVILWIYIGVITLLSPQPLALTSVADVRYLTPTIPLCIFVETECILALFPGIPWLVLATGAVVSWTNLLNAGFLFPEGLRSTITSYVGELIHPPGDPYTPTAQWINEHVPENASIWVEPDYMTYPLMFHAPKAIYAWQLAPNNHDPQFAALPPIHFQGRVPPDYIIVFGPLVQQIAPMISQWRGVRYEQVATINHFWKDLHRPELFWRTFVPITNYDPNHDAIYVFKRIEPASLTQ